MSNPKLKLRRLLAVMLHRLQPLFTPLEDEDVIARLLEIRPLLGIVTAKTHADHTEFFIVAEQDFVQALSTAPADQKLCALMAGLLHELQFPLFHGDLDDTARHVWAVRAALRMKPRDMKLYGGGKTGYLNHYSYTEEQILRRLKQAL